MITRVVTASGQAQGHGRVNGASPSPMPLTTDVELGDGGGQRRNERRGTRVASTDMASSRGSGTAMIPAAKRGAVLLRTVSWTTNLWRERCADRRGARSTDTLDRAGSPVVSAGDVGVEHCGDAPPKPLTDPCDVYLHGATTVADPAATGGICGQSRYLSGPGPARRADRWLDNRRELQSLRLCAPAA